MNTVLLIGRATRDAEIRETTGGKKVARYTLAVDRVGDGSDFIPCVCWGDTAGFAEKYIRKGTKIAIEGHISTGSYKNKEGKAVSTFEVSVHRHEFCEKKGEATEPSKDDGFITIPDGQVEELPFN